MNVPEIRMASKADASPKIKIVAISKNESAFLPYWIYHHFYFGFDSIDIYINRNSDNSPQVLEALKNFYPNLNYYYSDWVDWFSRSLGAKDSRMQLAVFNYTYYNTLTGFDYVFYIDVDEYWQPADNRTGIKACLKQLDYPNQATFEWLCLEPRAKYDFPGLENRPLEGVISYLGKSLVKTGFNMPLQYHIQKAPDYKRCVLADGRPLEFNPEFPDMQHLDKSVLGLKDFFLIHDWIRSPAYYFASLYNGYENIPTCGNYETLKWNRPAYNHTWDPAFPRCRHALPRNQDFVDGYAAMLEQACLAPFMKEALAFKLEQAIEAIDILAQNPGKPLAVSAVRDIGDLDWLREDYQVMLAELKK